MPSQKHHIGSSRSPYYSYCSDSSSYCSDSSSFNLPTSPPLSLLSKSAMTSHNDVLKHLSSFLSGSHTHDLSPLQTHLLGGWKPTTLESYNSAVRRFINFYEAHHNTRFTLPATDEDIYSFCLAVGRTKEFSIENRVTAKTLAKYLYALQAWHLFHQKPYPSASQNVVTVMLRASACADATVPPRPRKPAVLLHHLLALYNALNNDDPRDRAVLDCAICAFWGMARLAELTYYQPVGETDHQNSVLGGDVFQQVGDLSHVYLMVRGAKTAQPGVPQHILLNYLPNKLCPVRAIRRRLEGVAGPTDSLFGYTNPDGVRRNLTRSFVVSRCQQVWRRHGWNSITGHSFRVGGASLRAALGVDHQDIKRLGRWTSDCYTLYIRDYSSDDLTTALSILQALEGT